MRLVCEGLRFSEIAERLFRSIKTVEKHATNIRAKLGVTSITHAAVLFDRKDRENLDERAELLAKIERLTRAVAALEAE